MSQGTRTDKTKTSRVCFGPRHKDADRMRDNWPVFRRTGRTRRGGRGSSIGRTVHSAGNWSFQRRSRHRGGRQRRTARISAASRSHRRRAHRVGWDRGRQLAADCRGGVVFVVVVVAVRNVRVPQVFDAFRRRRSLRQRPSFVIVRDVELQNIKDVKSPPAHRYTAIFELNHTLDHRMMPCKFHDDISNGSGVIMLTDIQTDRQTYKTLQQSVWSYFQVRLNVHYKFYNFILTDMWLLITSLQRLCGFHFN